jgi:hypothetical protein
MPWKTYPNLKKKSGNEVIQIRHSRKTMAKIGGAIIRIGSARPSTPITAALSQCHQIV